MTKLCAKIASGSNRSNNSTGNTGGNSTNSSSNTSSNSNNTRNILGSSDNKGKRRARKAVTKLRSKAPVSCG